MRPTTACRPPHRLQERDFDDRRDRCSKIKQQKWPNVHCHKTNKNAGDNGSYDQRRTHKFAKSAMRVSPKTLLSEARKQTIARGYRQTSRDLRDKGVIDGPRPRRKPACMLVVAQRRVMRSLLGFRPSDGKRHHWICGRQSRDTDSPARSAACAASLSDMNSVKSRTRFVLRVSP
jgi:hypothetical protein